MRSALAITLMIAASGCGKKDDAKPAPGATAVEAKPSDSPVVPETDVQGPSPMGADLNGLGEKLLDQRKHRGPGPSTDAVFGAVEKLGLKIDSRQQILANSSGANYCENIHSGGLMVVACEFETDKAAADSKTRLDKDWAKLGPELVRTTHKATMLTVVHGGTKTPDVDRIVGAFNTL
jgi:hypothetical protein